MRGVRRLIVTAAVLVAPVASWVAAEVLTGRELRRQLRRLEALGRPMSVEALRPAPVEETENAAIVLRRAFAVMSGGTTNFTALAPAFERLDSLWAGETPVFDRLHADASLAAETRSGLARPEVVAALDLLRAAAARPRCDWRLAYERGPNLALPHLRPLGQGVSLMCLRSWAASRDGNLGEAFDWAGAAFSVAGMAFEDRTVVSFLTALHAQRRVLDTLPHILGPDAEAIEALGTAVARRRAELRSQLAVALDAERILFSDGVFHRLLDPSVAAADPPDSPRLLPRGFERWLGVLRPFVRANYARYLRLHHRLQEAIGSPSDHGLVGLERRVGALPGWAVFCKLLLPDVAGVAERAAEAELAHDIASLGLALELHWLRSGAYPDSLDDLGDAGAVSIPLARIPPVRYIREANGVVLVPEPSLAATGGRLVRGIRGGGAYRWEVRR